MNYDLQRALFLWSAHNTMPRSGFLGTGGGPTYIWGEKLRGKRYMTVEFWKHQQVHVWGYDDHVRYFELDIKDEQTLISLMQWAATGTPELHTISKLLPPPFKSIHDKQSERVALRACT